MKRNLNYIAIIPARSGSERIKDKNLIKINNLPLIAHAIETAKKTKLFSRVILSTDSLKYYKIGKKFGADDSKIRPKKISKSNSPDYEHIIFQLDDLKKKKIYFDVFVLLRPTSPFRTKKTIKTAINIFEKNCEKVDSLRAIKPVKEHPYKMWVKKDNLIKPIFPLKNSKGISFHSMQKKSLPSMFIQSAMIEISWVRNLKNKSISGNKILPFFSSEKENFDINDPEDLVIMKKYIKNKKSNIF